MHVSSKKLSLKIKIFNIEITNTPKYKSVLTNNHKYNYKEGQMSSRTNTLAMLAKRFNKDMLNRKEVAEFLDVSIGTITNLVKDKQIPYIKFGSASKTSTIRFEVTAISDWINGMNQRTNEVRDE